MTRRWHVERSRQEGGYTLVEMAVVVIIVGILAALGIASYRRYIRSARIGEAGEMINQIKAAQEAYRTDAFTYLDVSGTHSLADMSSFYPTTTPGNKKYGWGDAYGNASGPKWGALNVHTDGGGVYFAYGCAAGEPSDPVAGTGISVFGQMNMASSVANWPTALPVPWYVVKAVGDLDGDGKDATVFVSASFTSLVYNDFEHN